MPRDGHGSWQMVAALQQPHACAGLGLRAAGHPTPSLPPCPRLFAQLQVALLGVLSFVVFFLDCKELATRLGGWQAGCSAGALAVFGAAWLRSCTAAMRHRRHPRTPLPLPRTCILRTWQALSVA